MAFDGELEWKTNWSRSGWGRATSVAGGFAVDNKAALHVFFVPTLLMTRAGPDTKGMVYNGLRSLVGMTLVSVSGGRGLNELSSTKERVL